MVGLEPSEYLPSACGEKKPAEKVYTQSTLISKPTPVTSTSKTQSTCKVRRVHVHEDRVKFVNRGFTGVHKATLQKYIHPEVLDKGSLVPEPNIHTETPMYM